MVANHDAGTTAVWMPKRIEPRTRSRQACFDAASVEAAIGVGTLRTWTTHAIVERNDETDRKLGESVQEFGVPLLGHALRRVDVEIEHDVDDSAVRNARISEQRDQVRERVVSDASPDAVAVVSEGSGCSRESCRATGAWIDGHALPTITPSCAADERGCYASFAVEDPFKTAFEAEAAELQRRIEEHAHLRRTPAYVDEIRRIRETVLAFAATMRVCVLATTRWPEARELFFLRHVDELSNAALMSAAAFQEGAINAGRRELRFLLELATQAAYVDEAISTSPFATRLEFFGRKVKHHSADHVRDLKLAMLGSVRISPIAITETGA
jgi:hypothetical protein